MNKVFSYLGLLFFLPVWWLQRLVYRKKTLWVFGAWNGRRFSDNSKYLYQYTQEFHPEITAVWITRNKAIRDRINQEGGIAVLTNSLKGIYYSLLAKVVFVSNGKADVNKLFINGATLVHLWHGNPLKKIGLDDSYSSANSFQYKYIVKYLFPMSYEFNYDYIVSNAAVFSDKMASSYALPTNRVLETGCPRNDVFFVKEVDNFNKELKSKFKGCKLVYYLPTFRNLNNSVSLFTLEDYDKEKVERFLEEENIVLVSKGHYVDNVLESDKTDSQSRIINLQDENVSDINFMLKDADLLITDYSSAYFDFLLTEKPIIFAAFDLEEYMSSSRELYFEYKEVVAGPIVQNWSGLLESMKYIWNDTAYKELVAKKNILFNKYHDNQNSKRVFEAIVKRL